MPPPTPELLPLAVLPVVWTPVLLLPPTPVVVVLLVVLPVLLPVLVLSAFSALVRSSPLPVFPPATSPRESELFSPVSLWLPLVATITDVPALPLPLTSPPEDALTLLFELALSVALALPFAWALPFELALMPALAFPFAWPLTLVLALPLALELWFELAMLWVFG